MCEFDWLQMKTDGSYCSERRRFLDYWSRNSNVQSCAGTREDVRMLLDALDAAEARAEKTPTQAAECILRAVDEMRSLRAERDRLREALVRIVIRDGWKGRMFHLAEAIKIAAEAINRPECRDDCEACQIEQDEVSDGR